MELAEISVNSTKLTGDVRMVSVSGEHYLARPYQFPSTPAQQLSHPTPFYGGGVGGGSGVQTGVSGGSFPHAFSPPFHPIQHPLHHMRPNSHVLMPHPVSCNLAFYQSLMASGMPRLEPVIKTFHQSVAIYYPSTVDGSLHPSMLLHAIEQLILVEGYFYPTTMLPDHNEENSDKVCAKHRDDSVAVVRELHEAFFQLPDDVFATAVNMFDRLLSYVHIPPRCAKLALACCYFISAEQKVSPSELPLRTDLLCLIGKTCYDLNDFLDWETSIRGKLCVPHMPLAAATPLEYLRLFAAGYGLTRAMTHLLNKCLTNSELASYSPRVLAMSVFYACIPKSEWDALGYVKVLAQLCGIRGQPFIGCSLTVMQMARELDNPTMAKVYTSLQDWRDRCHLVRGERRTTSASSLQNLLEPILEE